VLLRQIDGELVEHLAGVALKGSEQRSITVHHDKSEFVVVGEQGSEGLRVELVVAQVKRRVDGLEWLEVYVHLLLLALLCDNGAAVDDQTVGRH